MGFGNWSVWRWVGLLLVVLALLVAVVQRDGSAISSLIVLLVVYLAANLACKRFTGAPTNVRLLWALGALVIFWWAFFLGVVPVADKVIQSLPQATAVKELDERLVSVADMPPPQRLYLALAFSIPTLLFVFGAGPFSQHGMMPGGVASEAAPPAGGKTAAPPPDGQPSADIEEG